MVWRHGVVWRGVALVLMLVAVACGVVWYGGMAWRGMAWRRGAWRGMAWHGVAWRGTYREHGDLAGLDARLGVQFVRAQHHHVASARERGGRHLHAVRRQLRVDDLQRDRDVVVTCSAEARGTTTTTCCRGATRGSAITTTIVRAPHSPGGVARTRTLRGCRYYCAVALTATLA